MGKIRLLGLFKDYMLLILISNRRQRSNNKNSKENNKKIRYKNKRKTKDNKRQKKRNKQNKLKVKNSINKELQPKKRLQIINKNN